MDQYATILRRTTSVAVVLVLAAVMAGCDEGAAGEDSTAAPAGVLDVRPVVGPIEGPAPMTLDATDIVVGNGPPARTGDVVVVQYVAAGYASGTTIDASWDRGAPLRLLAGAGEVVAGVDLAIVGDAERGIEPMRPGGRRRVVVPPDLAYGTQALVGLDEPGDTTLVFVLDLLAVEPSG